MFLIIIFVYIIQTCGCAKNFYSPELCRRTGDCSSQVGVEEMNMCQIYNTSVCKKFDFGKWTAEYPTLPIQYPIGEASANFGIHSILPYAGKYIPQQVLTVPAINITLTAASKDVTGFKLVIENSENFTLCRIFDFRRASLIKHQKVTIFYDCLHFLPAYKGKHFFLNVRALPINEELKYQIFIPETEGTEPSTLCDWKPLIMVFRNSLENNIVQVRFSQVPNFFSIQRYEVALISSPPNQGNVLSDSVLLNPKPGAEMISTEFRQVDIGYYFIRVKPLLETKKCEGAVTDVFFVPTELLGRSWSPPSILIVHFLDNAWHSAVITCFIKVLEYFKCKVSTIYGRGDPDHWKRARYEEATVLVIVLSYGAFHRLQNNVIPFVEDHIWKDQFHKTVSFLEHEIPGSEKKVAKVYFDYSGKHHIPDCLKLNSWGRTFSLPKELNKFLCYVNDATPKHCCHGINYSLIQNDVESFPEGRELVESIKKVKLRMNETSPCSKDSSVNSSLCKGFSERSNSDVTINICNTESCSQNNMFQNSYELQKLKM